MQFTDIKVGSAVFLKDGGSPIGSVHQLSQHGRREFVIYVENAGDFIIPYTAVKSLHFGKIILDVDQLDPKLRTAIAHVHDAETPE